jgi:hypothetical protein
VTSKNKETMLYATSLAGDAAAAKASSTTPR